MGVMVCLCRMRHLTRTVAKMLVEPWPLIEALFYIAISIDDIFF